MNAASGRLLSTRHRHRGTTLIGLALMSLTAGCATHGGIDSHSVKRDADQIRTERSLAAIPHSAAAWPSRGWWAAYGDTQLNDLIAQALRDQPSMRIAEARVRQFQAAAGAAKSLQAPQISAKARSTTQRFSENGMSPPTLAGEVDSVNEMTVDLSYELDLWGKNQSALEAAIGRTHASEADLKAAELLLTTSIVRTYLALNAAYELKDVADATIEQRERILALTGKRVAAQLDSRIELTDAEAALAAARQERVAAAESVTRLGNQLASLAGQGPDAGLDVRRPALHALPDASVPDSLPAELIGRRPDVVAARWRVEAAMGDVEVAKAQFYPNISITAFAGTQSVGLDNLTSIGSRIFGIGPAISLPIFNGGRLRSALAGNQASYDVAVEQYNATLVTALHDVVEQVVLSNSLGEQSRHQADALQLSEQSLKLANARYEQGLANYLQVLNAETKVLAQRRLAISLRTRQSDAHLNLTRALGGGMIDSDSVATAPSTK